MRRVFPCLVILLILAGCSAGPRPSTPPTASTRAVTAEPRSFSLAGRGCTEAGVGVVAENNIVKGFVPPEFDILLANDKAAFYASIVRCAQNTLDDAKLGAGAVGNVMVLLAGSPDGDSADLVYYEIWFPTDLRPVGDAFLTHGFLGNLATNESVSTSATGAAQTVRGAVVGSEAPFSFELTSTQTGPAAAGHTAIAWHKDLHGYTKVKFQVGPSGTTSGRGVLMAESGSPVAQLAGSPSANGGAVVGRFDYTAHVEWRAALKG